MGVQRSTAAVLMVWHKGDTHDFKVEKLNICDDDLCNRAQVELL